MTRYTLFAALFLAFAVFTPMAHAAAPTIAVVDVERLYVESKAAKSLKSQIEAKKESFRKEFSAKEAELKKLETTLMAEREKLSAEEFGKQRKAFEEKILEARKLFQKRSNSLDDGQKAAMRELRKGIAEATTEVAEAKSYDVVLTRDSVVIAEKALDITADVLKKLDEKISNVSLKVE